MVGDNLHMISRVQIEVNERLAAVTGRGRVGARALVGGPGIAVPGYRGVEGHGGVDY